MGELTLVLGGLLGPSGPSRIKRVEYRCCSVLLTITHRRLRTPLSTIPPSAVRRGLEIERGRYAPAASTVRIRVRPYDVITTVVGLCTTLARSCLELTALADC